MSLALNQLCFSCGIINDNEEIRVRGSRGWRCESNEPLVHLARELLNCAFGIIAQFESMRDSCALGNSNSFCARKPPSVF